MKNVFIGVGAALLFVSTMVTTAAVVNVPTAKAACNDRVLMIPAWYKGLDVGNGCTGVKPDSNNLPKFLTILVMNIVQALLVIAAYVTIFFIIRGGFGYMTSAGSSDGMASAKKTVTNALIGLVIAILSASIVNAIAGLIR